MESLEEGQERANQVVDVRPRTFFARRGRVTIVAPLLILMIGLGVVHWLFPDSTAGVAGVVVQQTVSPASAELPEGETDETAPVLTPPLLGLATPWGIAGRGGESPPAPATAAPLTPAATPVDVATLPPDTTIQLLGPPQDGRFRLDDDISFYWRWPLPLQTGQRFAVYLRSGNEEWRLGVLEHNNLGSAYRLRAQPADFVSAPADYEWLVRLETLVATANGASQALTASETRTLRLTEE